MMLDGYTVLSKLFTSYYKISMSYKIINTNSFKTGQEIEIISVYKVSTGPLINKYATF